MSSESINFTINLNGNAYKGVLNLGNAVENVVHSANKASSVLERFGDVAFNVFKSYISLYVKNNILIYKN